MCVGGWIIERKRVTIAVAGARTEVTQYWLYDPTHHDELIVTALPEREEPAVGANVWFQGRTIYWDGDKRRLVKIGNAFDPHRIPGLAK